MTTKVKNQVKAVSKNKTVVINGMRFVHSGGFLSLAGKVNTIDKFHIYSHKN